MRQPVFLLVLVVVFFMFCKNPFFPQTGTPIIVDLPRSTPELTIAQLIDAYESQRIDLFLDLLPKDKSFQFFVAPSFIPEKSIPRLQEQRDPRLINIVGETFYYWTHQEEVRSHERMFKNAETIIFKQRPVIDLSKVNYLFSGQGDTIAVEVVMNGGDLEISELVGNVRNQYTVSIEKQVFLLEKDEYGLWVIRKWYDLSNAQ